MAVVAQPIYGRIGQLVGRLGDDRLARRASPIRRISRGRSLSTLTTSRRRISTPNSFSPTIRTRRSALCHAECQSDSSGLNEKSNSCARAYDVASICTDTESCASAPGRWIGSPVKCLPIGKTAKGELVYSLDCRDIPGSTSGDEPQVAPTPPATVLPKAPESK
jgi:hypothetical protein